MKTWLSQPEASTPAGICHDGRDIRQWIRVTQTLHRWQAILTVCCILSVPLFSQSAVFAAGGEFAISVEDEATRQLTVARVEIVRADGKVPLIKKALRGGRGMALVETFQFELPDGPYQFRISRGPESRIITGRFELERTSKDDITVVLPRMVDMKKERWISCDLCVPPQTEHLEVRMMAEDLHFAATLGPEPKPTPAALMPHNTLPYSPLWISSQLLASNDKDLLFFPTLEQADAIKPDVNEVASQQLARLSADGIPATLANPFSWALPVHVASGQVDGIFVMGEWLREDRRMARIEHGRPAHISGFDDATGPGRYAEFIYWNLLEAGCYLPPLAGTGVGYKNGNDVAIGYNRLYVTAKEDSETVEEEQAGSGVSLSTGVQCLESAFAGRSVVTNGPMLRPTLGGFRPGHVFEAVTGEQLELGVELNLSVRDEVEYLEIIHNGRSFHQARLDEFTEAGGKLPIMKIKKSGWVIVRVVTKHQDHYRMAMSAPWYIVFDATPRINFDAVRFFGTWLNDYEQRLRALPEEKLQVHVPFVVAARQFWRERLEQANTRD